MLFKSTKNFTQELKKHLDEKNVQITICPFLPVIENTYVNGTWNGIDYNMVAHVKQKGAEMEFYDGLERFIEILGEKNISELNSDNLFNLRITEAYGREVEIKEIEWERLLNNEELEELEDYGGEHELFEDGSWDIDGLIFNSGDILEIKVKINDNEYFLRCSDYASRLAIPENISSSWVWAG